MNGLGPGLLGRGNDARNLQVTLGRDRWTDADRLIGQFEIGRAAIGLGVDDGDFDSEVAAGTDDPQGNLPAVGDEDLLEHQLFPSSKVQVPNSGTAKPALLGTRDLEPETIRKV